MELLETVSAERMPAVHEDAGNSLAYIEVQSAKVAKIKSPGGVITLNEVLGHSILSLLLVLLLGLFSLLTKGLVGFD